MQSSPEAIAKHLENMTYFCDMGRKSNTKKELRRKIEEEEALNEQPVQRSVRKKMRKEVKMELQGKPVKEKKSDKKSKKKKKKFSEFQKQRIVGGVTVILTALILLVFGFLIFQKAFRAMPIAKFLPADETVGFIEFNTDTEHSQYLQSMELLGEHKAFFDTNIVQNIENFWGINFDNQIKPWLGRQMGMALVNSSQNESAAHLIYFAEIENTDVLEKMLNEKTASHDYKGRYIYSTTPSAYMTVIKDYLVVSVEEIGIKEIIDFNFSQSKKLYYTSKYRRIDDNAPLNKAANIYIDFDLINEGTLAYLPFFTDKGISMNMITPLKALFDAEGISLVALADQFAIQGFVSLDRENFSGSRFVGFNPKYDAGLANYVSSDALSFWGGENFEFQIDRIINVLSAGDKAKSSLLDSLVQNYAQRYFGTEITLEDDIAPLLSKEFAIALEPGEGKANYKIILELDDPEVDSKRLTKVINQFAQINSVANVDGKGRDDLGIEI